MRIGQRGAILITGIILIVVIAVMVATMGFLYIANLRSSSLHSSSEQAYFAAFSGLERATRVVNSPTLAGAVAPDVNRVTCAGLTGSPAVTNVTVVANKGQFTVIGGLPVSPANPVTLNGALTAVATVIPVITLANLGGYSASGRIMIDRELIDYAGTSNVAAVCGVAPCFVGARRGAAGTTAVAHATGTRVGQFQCNVQARGAVPDLVNPRAARILSQSTQLHQGWAAGKVAAGKAGPAQRPWTVNFRENAWIDSINAIPNANAQINSISMLSNADGFAVGNAGAVAATRPLVIRWNGTVWNSVNTGLNINRTLNGVYCNSANDCWAVGNQGAAAAQRPWVVRWNGAWASFNTGINVNAALNKVYCVSTAECYAVGAPGPVTRRPFTIRWNGAAWSANNNAAINVNVALNGVHCAGPNDCWAVGNAGGVAAQRPFLIRWNGAAWAAFNTGLNLNLALQSVYCVATTDCWAVGNPGGVAAQRPFVIRWNGAAWALFNTGLNTNAILRSVWCVKTDDCWAVGDAVGGAEFIIRWNGTAWTRMGPLGTVADRGLLSVIVTGASQRAPSSRQEVFP